jgi:Uma2 family endonuclease
MVAQLPLVIYPDSDGKPIADNTKQFELIVYLKTGLDGLFVNDPNVFIAGDLLWYPVEGNPKIATAPDVMVAFGRPKGYRGSYKQWEEKNIAPQVVFEILSPSNSRQEMGRKLLFYDRYGVEEYYIYNSDCNELTGWLRNQNNSILEPIEELNNWSSPRLQIKFDLSSGDLIVYNPDGSKFYSYIELKQLWENERQRAENERQRAENERQRAQESEHKLAEMEELLQKYRAKFGDLNE